MSRSLKILNERLRIKGGIKYKLINYMRNVYFFLEMIKYEGDDRSNQINHQQTKGAFIGHSYVKRLSETRQTGIVKRDQNDHQAEYLNLL